jgi:hypothetical protein
VAVISPSLSIPCYNNVSHLNHLCDGFTVKLVAPDKLGNIVRFLSVLVTSATTTPSGALIRRPSPPNASHTPLWEFLLNPATLPAIEAVAGTVRGRLFANNRRYLGTASRSTREGNTIVLFYGCRVPFVLWPCLGMYRLLGPANVHGIMRGEFCEPRSVADFTVRC